MKNTAPDCAQIDRACRIFGAGGDLTDVAHAFRDELTGEGVWLAWHAAKASHAIDERHPLRSTR